MVILNQRILASERDAIRPLGNTSGVETLVSTWADLIVADGDICARIVRATLYQVQATP